jgi:preprotein translocase subunit SecA
MSRIFKNTARYSAAALKRNNRRSMNSILNDMKSEYSVLTQRFGSVQRVTDIEAKMLLKIIDTKWAKHLESLEFLRQGAMLQSYGQNDPKAEYAAAAYDLFDKMIVEDTVDSARTLLKLAAS